MSDTTGPRDKLQALRDGVTSAATPAERVKATLLLAEELWLSDPVAAGPLLEQVVAESLLVGYLEKTGRDDLVGVHILIGQWDDFAVKRCVFILFSKILIRMLFIRADI